VQTVFKDNSKNWNKLILAIAGLGILLVIIDHFFESEFLRNLGIFSFSFAAILVGLEAVIERKIILQSRYSRRLSETYLGAAAIAQGLLIILLAFFILSLPIIDYLNAGQKLFEHFVRRPGILFIIFSFICFLTVIAVGIGSVEEKQGPKFVVILNLIAGRILGPTILFFIGLFFFGLGILEIINPAYFDSLGGGFLEVIFLGQKTH
jgi:hypothetical protein